MKLSDIKKILDKSGYPAAYRFFKTKKEPPYICYFIPDSRNINADDINYKGIKHLFIELYTADKNETAENIVENILNENEICFNKIETYIETEKIYMILYDTEVF